MNHYKLLGNKDSESASVSGKGNSPKDSSNSSNSSNAELKRTSMTLIISRIGGGPIWYVSELREGHASSTCSFVQGAKVFKDSKEAWSYIRSSGYRKTVAELLLPVDFPLIQVSTLISQA